MYKTISVKKRKPKNGVETDGCCSVDHKGLIFAAQIASSWKDITFKLKVSQNSFDKLQ